MSILGDSVAAAVFTDRADADEAWAMLAGAEIPAAVVTDPGILGSYEVQVVVARDDLDAAQRVIAPLIDRRR
jgi:hypothetical protein